MASQYPIERVFTIRLISDPDQELLDTLHPDTRPELLVYVEVSIDGIPRGSMALTGVTRDGSDRLAILGMTGTPGFIDIAMRAVVIIANHLGLDGAMAEAMTPAHGRLYRRALNRLGGVRNDG